LMSSNNLKLCRRCILPHTFPNIKFDGEGVCNHCRQEELALTKAPIKKAEYQKRLNDLISATRDKAPFYDIIMAYSGGKDSSYTLKLLKERYHLRIVALTLDNHFVASRVWANIAKIADVLEVDHMTFRPSWSVIKALFSQTAREDIFSPATLLRASAMCTACIGLVKSLVLKVALEMSIPLVAFGWSPGQAPIQSAIMKTNPSFMRQNQKALKAAFSPDLLSSMAAYFLPDSYYGLDQKAFPTNIHPLAFFDYNEEKIKAELEAMGWKAPADTDANSTNCLLNAFANQCHLERHSFHPYVWEIANMVRQGVMTRPEGIKKIYSPQNPDQVEYARRRLGL
jgi:tRNA(Ile)-lysidine synthase TilS/MesJ